MNKTADNYIGISLSAVNSYRACEQQYYYRYVERLSKKMPRKQLETGSMIHLYLETYYLEIRTQQEEGAGFNPRYAHQLAQVAVSREYSPRLKRARETFVAAGMLTEAKWVVELEQRIRRIMDNYFFFRGESDAEEYEILHVEVETNVNILRPRGGLPRVTSFGKVDLVTRNKYNGRLNLWEHKSGEEIPEQSKRLRDLQTLLYTEKLKVLGIIGDERIDATIWNYVRTKEPTVPEVLKSGGLTKRANLDSTWTVYLAELDRLHLPFDEYDEQKIRLEGRELTAYFPRFEQPILVRPEILMRDYVTTAKQIRDARALWELGSAIPTRNLSLTCEWCEFKELCNAVIFTGSDEDERHMYEERKRQ